MAAKANIIIDQGTTFSTEITVTQANGAPLGLSGYTAAGQIRKHYASMNSTPFTVSTGANADLGVLTVSLSANTTQTLTAGRYVYDIELYNSGNTVVTRVVEGMVTVTPGVTRAYSETV